MNITNKNEYYTRDIAEAGILVVKKQSLVRIDREDRTCWFVFNDKEKCEQLANRYLFGELLVNAREYYEVLNRLKNKIFHG